MSFPSTTISSDSQTLIPTKAAAPFTVILPASASRSASLREQIPHSLKYLFKRIFSINFTKYFPIIELTLHLQMRRSDTVLLLLPHKLPKYVLFLPMPIQALLMLTVVNENS